MAYQDNSKSNVEFKQGLARYLEIFYNDLITNTIALDEFKARGLSHAFAFVPGRMIDSAMDMLNKWRESTNLENSPSSNAILPVCLVCVDNEAPIATSDFTRQMPNPVEFSLDGVTTFKMSLSVNNRRVQLVFVSPDVETFRSFELQLGLFISSPDGRRFYANYPIQGQSAPFSCVLEDPETAPFLGDTGQKNLIMGVIDLNFKESVPLIRQGGALLREVIINENTVVN